MNILNKRKEKHTIVRTGKILNAKFRKYFLPATISAIAVSLNEFVDSLLVAQLLDSKSMSIINIASPVIFIACSAYILFGAGGAIQYSFYLGERKHDDASQTLTMSLVLPVLLMSVVATAGLMFLSPIAKFLVSDAISLLEPMKRYLVPTLLVTPLLAGVCAYIAFLPSFGKPGLASTIAISTNVVNLCFDYIFIKIFNYGVEGAGFATIVGYLVGLTIIIYVEFTGKVRVKYGKFNLKHFVPVFKKGLSGSIGQIGLALRTMVCNGLAIKYGGETGVAIMAVCDQVNSIICIILTGITDASSPIVSLLHGQRDHAGKKYVVRQMLTYNTVTIFVEVILLSVFSIPFMKLYNIPSSSFAEGSYAIIIYSIMSIFKTYIVCFEYIFELTGKELYSTLISLIYGVLGIIGFSIIFTSLFGLRGLWYGYLFNAVLTFVGILVINYFIKNKNDKYGDILLLEVPEKGSIQMDASLGASNKSIEKLSESISDFCKENNVSSLTAMKVGLVAEEMVVYTRNHHKGHFDIDVLLNITSDNIYLDFRSDTTPFNPVTMDEKDNEENYKVLKSLAGEIEYSYLLGMNSTRIVMKNN